MAGQDFKVTGQGSRKQNTAAGIRTTETASITKEDAVGAAERANREIDMKGLGLDRTGFQNTIPGAAAARETAEAILPAQTVESVPPYSQIRDEILTKLEQSGSTEFKMQLDPEDLGQIDIKLKLSEGK